MAQLISGAIPQRSLPTNGWPTRSIPGTPGGGSSGVRRLALSRIEEEYARPAIFVRPFGAFAGPKVRRQERKLKLGKQIRELEERIRSSTNRHVVISSRRRIRSFKKELEEMAED